MCLGGRYVSYLWVLCDHYSVAKFGLLERVHLSAGRPLTEIRPGSLGLHHKELSYLRVSLENHPRNFLKTT